MGIESRGGLKRLKLNTRKRRSGNQKGRKEKLPVSGGIARSRRNSVIDEFRKINSLNYNELQRTISGVVWFDMEKSINFDNRLIVNKL